MIAASDAIFTDLSRVGGYLAVMPRSVSPNLAIGSTNLHSQTVVEHTDRPGTDHGQYVYMLRCDSPTGCQGLKPSYGANGTNFHERLCPRCQGGGQGI